MEAPIKVATDETGIRTITIDRPEAMNGLNLQVSRLLREQVLLASRDPSVKVVIVTGAGRNFCAGGDFKNFGALDPDDELALRYRDDPVWNDIEEKSARFESGAETTHMLHTMGKPTIAMVRGPSVGAGVGLAAACDFRIASDTASFQSGYIRVGISPDYGTSYTVTQLIGPAKARELYLFNEKIDAAEALRIGLVTRVVPDAELESQTLAFARRLAAQAPVAMRYIKQNLNAAETENMRNVIAMEARNMARTFQTEDAKEAVTAFIQKREAKFKGR